jgi:hypothetical protein
MEANPDDLWVNLGLKYSAGKLIKRQQYQMFPPNLARVDNDRGHNLLFVNLAKSHEHLHSFIERIRTASLTPVKEIQLEAIS